MFGVYVLFGAIAALAALAGIGLMIAGMIAPGLIAIVVAAVLGFMSVSIGKSYRETA